MGSATVSNSDIKMYYIIYEIYNIHIIKALFSVWVFFFFLRVPLI